MTASFADQVGQFMGPFVGRVPHNKRLGLRFVTAGTNWVELQLPFAPHLLVDPDHGIWASGPIFTLMDTAVGMASMLARGAFEPHATLDLRTDYVRSPRAQATVIARGECYRMTRQIAFVRGLAHDGDPADPIAHVAGTFMFAPSKLAEGWKGSMA
ncbi:PaaI family thioesterase [Sandarakinorhabdus sp.]|uniref:PaaI family thioesterase n=1 Tax=Sandarakinorhabdus sp. TaxID=1916663 RepID=UPI003F72922F